ncbi:hypothetical protein [Mycetocola zhujimingii]|uniref:hypothetical protein n=1 Tax=Mycetocola zhujimingii TaxID=2079792 RepID=UPI001E5658C0|nr:hypothetical protein [Mycetocola zhujimingii]
MRPSDLWRRLRWWGRVLVIAAAGRLISTAILVWFAQRQPANAWTGPSPAYADFASLWDGRWYHIVALSGYPAELPVDADGHVAENAWAFMPVYPAVVRLVMGLTGLGWAPAAVVVSVLATLGATLVFYRLMRLVLDESTALFSVVLFSVAPLSPILQVAYAESLHVLLLAAALYLVLTRRYLPAAGVIAVMCFTRPSGLAFSLFLVLHVLVRWFRCRATGESLRDLVPPAALAVLSGALGLAWPAIAWAVTGSITAYTDTELAWRSAYIGHGHLVPFAPWFQGLDWWATNGLGLPESPWWGILGVAVLALLAVLGLLSPPARRLGVDLRLWLASYLIYLFAVFFPQSSTFRLLVPLFPAAGAFAVPRSRVYRVCLVIACIAGQIGWVLIAWRVDGYDWTPP